jgi:cytochrome c556
MPRVQRSTFLAGAALVTHIAVLVGQAPQAPAQPQGRGGAQPQPILPVAVSAVVATPDAYVGRSVSLTAAVEQRFGATAFSIDQDTRKSSTGILVLAPVLTAPVEPNSYVTVIGEVVTFDQAIIATRMKDAMPALSADVIETFRGRPAIIAASVINSAMADLAKRLPPPMTADEEALSKQMKQIGPGFNALRQAVTATNASDVRAQALILNKAFGEAAAFWKTKTHPDATQWNEDAKRESDALAAAAGRSDWDAIKAGVPKLQSVCSSCHGQYRERLDDGTYRYRSSAAR